MIILRVLFFLVVAAICGAVGSAIAGRGHRGCCLSTVIGLVGALVGSWLSRVTGIPDLIYLWGTPVLWTVAGSALFVAVVGFLSGRR